MLQSKGRVVLVLAALSLLVALPATAQPVRKGAGAKRGGPPADLLEKVRERVRMMRMWKLTELLELDEATAAKLFPLLKTWDEKLEPLRAEIQQLRQELKKIVAKKLDDKTAIAVIDRMLATRNKVRAVTDQRIADVRRVLTASQQARLILVMPKIDRAIEAAVRKAVRGKLGAGPGAIDLGSGDDDDDID